MADDKFITLDDTLKKKVEVTPIETSSGTTDSGKIARTSNDGKFDESLISPDFFHRALTSVAGAVLVSSVSGDIIHL